MREVFERSWKTLSKIAFMLSPDIERLLDKQCQVCTYVSDSVLFRRTQMPTSTQQ